MAYNGAGKVAPAPVISCEYAAIDSADNKIANSFLKSYLNDKWQAKVEFKSVKDYDGKKDLWLHKMDYSESNQ